MRARAFVLMIIAILLCALAAGSVSGIDNCCFVDRQCSTDQEWIDGYWAFQNNQCSAPAGSGTTGGAPAQIDNCCYVDRQCQTDQQWIDGYWAFQNNQCSARPGNRRRQRHLSRAAAPNHKSTIAVTSIANAIPTWNGELAGTPIGPIDVARPCNRRRWRPSRPRAEFSCERPPGLSSGTRAGIPFCLPLVLPTCPAPGRSFPRTIAVKTHGNATTTRIGLLAITHFRPIIVARCRG